VCKILLATGTMVGYAYSLEFFIAWYSAVPYEQFAFVNRAMGPYWWAYLIMFVCNAGIPQIFWFKWARRNILLVFIVSIFVNIGMWFERFVIIASSLHRDFLPSSWAYFTPTWVDIAMFIGSFGLFFTFFLLFVRFLPIIAIAEVKTVLPQAKAHPEPADAAAGEHKH
jgi:Ni/Fe-hydrogenase subunit HybB-like protein